MVKIIIYEGMMCCSTGLCGPEPDRKLIEFNEAVNRLKKNKINIQRLNLSSHVDSFNKNKEIIQKIQKEGVGILPLTTVDNKIVMQGKYPTYAELSSFINTSYVKTMLHDDNEVKTTNNSCCKGGGCCR